MWGAISCLGQTPAHFFDEGEKVNGDVHNAVVQDIMVPILKRQQGSYFVQDNATSHNKAKRELLDAGFHVVKFRGTPQTSTSWNTFGRR